jgi:hypothetical protein
MRTVRIACVCVALVLGGAACREEGPGEKAGRKLDEAVERLRHGDEGALEKAGRELDEVLEDTLEAVEESVDDAREAVADAIEGDAEG